MNAPRDLRLHVVPPGCGGSFTATQERGLALLQPLSEEAAQWLRAHVGDEASWNGNELVIENRYFPTIAEAIIDAGFLFEGDEDGMVFH